MAIPVVPFAKQGVAGGTALSSFLKQEKGLLPQAIKVPASEDRELFTHIYGVPTPFLQLGTYLGLDGGTALAVDIALDPLTYVTGGITKAGRADKAFRAIFGTKKALEVSAQFKRIKKMRGLAAAQEWQKTKVVEQLRHNVEIGAKLSGSTWQDIELVLGKAGTDKEAMNFLRQMKLEEIRKSYAALGTPTKEANKELRFAYAEIHDQLNDAVSELAKAEKRVQEATSKAGRSMPTPEELTALKDEVEFWKSAKQEFADHLKNNTRERLAATNRDLKEISGEIKALEGQAFEIMGLEGELGLAAKATAEGGKLADATAATGQLVERLRKQAGKLSRTKTATKVKSRSEAMRRTADELEGWNKLRKSHFDNIEDMKSKGLSAEGTLDELDEWLGLQKQVGSEKAKLQKGIKENKGVRATIKEVAVEVKDAEKALLKAEKAAASLPQLERATKRLEFTRTLHDDMVNSIKLDRKAARESVSASLAGRTSPYEFRNDNISNAINSVRQGMLNEGRQGAGRGGIERAGGFVRGAIQQRARLVNLAKDIPTTMTKAEYRKIAKEILSLSPDARAMRIYKDNRRNMEAMVEAAMRGDELNPLARAPGLAKEGHLSDMRGAWSAQAALKQRQLLGARIPFTDLGFTIMQGGGGFDAIEGAVRAMRKVPATKPLVLGSRGAGMVDNALASTARMNEAMGADAPVAHLDTLFETLDGAVEATKGLPDEVWKFQNMSEAFFTELARAEVFGSRITPELHAAMRNMGLTVDVDGALVAKLVDAPEGLVKNLGKVEPGTFGDTVFHEGVELTEKAKGLGYTSDHLELASVIDTALRKVQFQLSNEGLVESFLSHYFPRIVTVVDGPKWEKAKLGRFGDKYVKNFYRHGRARLFDDIEDLLQLEKEGVLEVEKDIGKILGSYFSATGRSAATQRLYQNSRDIKIPVGESTRVNAEQAKFLARHPEGLPLFAHPASVVKGQHVGGPVAQHFGDHYVTVSLKDQNRGSQYVAQMAESVEGKPNMLGETRRMVAKDGRVLVHKDYVGHLRRIAEPGQKESVRDIFKPGAQNSGERLFEASLAVNAVQKRGLLFWSMFHHMALTESATADLGSDFFSVIRQLWKGGGATGFTNGHRLARGERSFFETADIMETATRNGLQLGALADAEVDIFQKAMKYTARKIPASAGAMAKLGQFEMRWNKGLWDYYHNGLKLYAWHTLYHKALARHGGSVVDGMNQSKRIARAVSEHVNNAFGGQMWGAFWAGKRGVQWARNFWLAPDWTASNLKIAGDVFGNWTKRWTQGKRGFGSAAANFMPMLTVTADDILRADVRAVFARQYAVRATMMMLVAQNFVNLAFTGHFMDGNPEGHRTQVMLPWRDDNGRGLFLKFGKQFREPMEFLTDAPDTLLRRKLSGVASLGRTIFTGTNYNGAPITTAENGPLMFLLKRSGIHGLARASVPITMQNAYKGLRESGPLGAIGAAGPGFLGFPLRTEFQRGSGGQLIDDELLSIIMQQPFMQEQDTGPAIPDFFQDITDEAQQQGLFAREQEQAFSIRGF